MSFSLQTLLITIRYIWKQASGKYSLIEALYFVSGFKNMKAMGLAVFFNEDHLMLGMSNKEWPNGKGLQSWSLKPIPDTPRRAHR